MNTYFTAFLLFCLLLPVSLEAQTYSCRDKQGRLYFSDNLMSLPAECLGREEQVKPGKADNLNYVPAQPTPQGSGAEFERSVRAAEQEQQQKVQHLELLKKRAESLMEGYQQAVAIKRQALRRWTYSSREEIKKADLQIDSLEKQRQALLQELSGVKISAAEKRQIEKALAEMDE